MARRRTPGFYARKEWKLHLVPEWVVALFRKVPLLGSLLRWLSRNVYYYRRYSATMTARTQRAGFTGDGFKLGRLGLSRTHGDWTFDTPGPGGYRGGMMPHWIRAFIFSPTRHDRDLR